MVKKLANKKIIIYLAIYIFCSHLFISVAQFFFSRYFFDFIERLAVDALIICAVLFLIEASSENKNAWKNYLRDYFDLGQILLAALFGAFLISLIIRGILDGFNIAILNQTYMYDLFVSAFIIFPVGKYFAHEKFPKIVVVLAEVVMLILSIYMVCVVVSVFSSKPFHTPSGGFIGMIEWNETLELAINCHPNTVGAYSALILFICVYSFYKTRGLRKALYFLFAIIHFVVLALSNSRGAFLATLCASGMTAAVCTYYGLRKTENKKRWICAIALGITIPIVLYFVRHAIFSLYEGTLQSEEIVVEEQAEVIRDIEPTFTNNRILLWKCTVQVIFSSCKNALIGVTPLEIDEILTDMVQWDAKVYTHNQFLEVAADIGLPALAVFLVFMFLLARHCLQLGLRPVQDDSWVEKLLPVMILFLVIANLVEAMLLFYGYLSGCIFVFLCGYVFEMCKSVSD